MSKKILSVLLAVCLAVFMAAPAVMAVPGDNKAKNSDKAQQADVVQEESGSVADDTEGGEDEESVTDEVYGKGNHKGISNALQHVKNPVARTALQAILDGKSVSEAVYEFKSHLDENIDPADVDAVLSEIEAEIEGDSYNTIDRTTKGLTYKYMAQIKVKAGKNSEALKYMSLSVSNNPEDDEAFRDLDKLFAKFNDRSVKVYINGKTPSFDVPPRIVDGRTLVPVRFIAEGLGANVNYDGQTGTVTVEGPGISIKMEINSKIVYVNGQPVELDVPAAVESGRTLVPLRFIGEGFKCKVMFYGESNLVSVNGQ